MVLSDTIRIPGAVTPDTGALSVSSLDVFEMLQKGSLLNDNVVQGYINLLGSSFGSSHGVRVVNTHFLKIWSMKAGTKSRGGCNPQK